MHDLARQQGRARAAAAAAPRATHTQGDAPEARGARTAADALFAGVSEAERLRIELIVRAAVDQDAALVAVVACLVGDADPSKCDAIVEAFTSNPALQQQWQGAWQQLRA